MKKIEIGDYDTEYICASCGECYSWPIISNCSTCGEAICETCEHYSKDKKREGDQETFYCPFCKGVFSVTTIL